MAKKNSKISLIERDWERLNGDSDRKAFIQQRINSFIKLFTLQSPGSINYDIYKDINILIRLTTSSGILDQLEDEYVNRFQNLIKLSKKEDNGIDLIRLY
jgi:hypothetical protein